jgi:transposase
VVEPVPHGRWQTYSLLAGLRLGGVVAPLLVDGPVNACTFEGYVGQVLAPQLSPGDVLVLDNLSAPKGPGVWRAVEAAGARVLYLPPYSPDFNPIERMWSKIKAYLRKAKARTPGALLEAFAGALRAVTPDECRAYFEHCGYHATQKRKTL